MIADDKRMERLIEVASLYYEKNMNQQQVAAALGISRPLVSVLLNEARATGVVTITVNRAENVQQLLAQQVEARLGVRRALVIPDGASADETDDAVARAAFELCFRSERPSGRVGVGWGSLLGRMADYAETLETPAAPERGRIFPLIGGIGASYRGYHTNELVRILSCRAGMAADYLYLPAFFDSAADLDTVRRMESYAGINSRWDDMDLAVVNISNYPSYPDLGVEYRFGGRLTREGAVSRVLAHYFDLSGREIAADVDNALQASAAQLAAAGTVAVCSSLLRPQSVAGAVAAGFVDTLLLPQSLASRLLESR